MSNLVIQLVPTQPIYTDEGSGADMNVAIYEPILPDGWYFLGHVAVTMPGSWAYTDPIVAAAAPWAVAVQGSAVQPAEAPPSQPLWTDQHSGGDQSIEIFTFTGPSGCYAVGLFASIVQEYGTSPASNPMWSRLATVAGANLAPGDVGELIWKDQGSGADGGGVWQNISLFGVAGASGLVPASTFVAAEGYADPPITSTTPTPQLLASIAAI